MLFTILALITLAVMAALLWFLHRVPEAPLCPRCGGATAVAAAEGITGSAAAGAWRWLERRVDGWLDDVAARRECTACGWAGRQRGAAASYAVRRADSGSRR